MRHNYSAHCLYAAMAMVLNTIALHPAHADTQAAHTIAERFAGAHETKPQTVIAPGNLKPEQVENVFKARKQENDLERTKQILDSVEARTQAIEKLLRKTAPYTWETTLTPQQTPPLPPNETVQEAIAKSAQTGQADTKPEIVRDVAIERTIETVPETAPEKTPEIAIESAQTTHETPNNGAQQGATRIPESRAQDVTDLLDLPEPKYALGGPAKIIQGVSEASERLPTVTVLLLLEPGKKGIRRFKKTADPVLCGHRHCYISQGTANKAQRVHRGAALGPFNTIGRRAGACRQTLSCAFRHVDVMDHGTLLQPIDLKFIRHDRRAYRNLKPDPTCKLSAGRLFCATPIVAKTWKAWVVPEHLARQAGADALETALKDGLPETPVPTIHVQHNK